MIGTRHALRGPGRSTRARSGLAIVSLVAALAVVVALMSVASERAQGSRESARAYPAILVRHLESTPPGGGTAAGVYKQPSDIASLDGRLFLLDTGNNRIVEIDEAGTVRRALDQSTDEQLVLQGAMAIAGDGRYLYVASSGAAEVLVLEPGGSIVRTVDLKTTSPGDEAPRPIGLAAGPDGELFISDAQNHRVLFSDGSGPPRPISGNGTRGSGSDGFNVPAGLALDDAGNVYVTDILNGRVVQLSANGKFRRQFGRLGDTGGTLSRPKDVAVDSAGNVYVSDSLLASVQVFSGDGTYLGFIGRENPDDAHSRSLFQAPAGLEIVGDKLYVVDRFAGLLVFQLPR